MPIKSELSALTIENVGGVMLVPTAKGADRSTLGDWQI